MNCSAKASHLNDIAHDSVSCSSCFRCSTHKAPFVMERLTLLEQRDVELWLRREHPSDARRASGFRGRRHPKLVETRLDRRLIRVEILP
jgi:hypothetical protein